MTQEDEKHYRKILFVVFVRKKFISDKIRDHCHSTGGESRGPAHRKCNINFTQANQAVLFRSFVKV